MFYLRREALGLRVRPECSQEGGGQPKAGEQGRHLEEEMRLCCMISCAPRKGAVDVGYPTNPPSKTKPCGAIIMPDTPCKEKVMEKEVREGSGCEKEDGEAGADGERRLPINFKIGP